MFHVRRRPADYHPRKRKKKPQQKWNHQSSTEMHEYRYEDGFDRLPFFLELNPDGSDIAGGTAKRHRLHPNVTEVGSERASPHSQSQTLQLFGPNIQPRHCVIAHTEGIVTVTPCSRDAETYVNGQRIYETTILQNGAIVKFGRIHNFRFCDPCHDERIRQRHDSARTAHDYSYDRQSTGSQPPVTPTPTQNYETTFDVDGNVETRSTSSLGNKEETRSQRSVGSSSRDGNRLSNYERYPRGNDPILPAVLELREEKEEALLHELITNLEPNSLVFKLAPAYTLYLAARYRASTHYRPELTPTERAYKLTLMLARVAAMIHNVIQERYCEVKSLALWLANASELLHFLKSDRHVSAFSLDAQDTLADAVQIAFRHLVACLQAELAAVMPNFLSDREDLSHDPEDSSTASVLGVLASAMALLRRCRVNAALTIQLFSQLFHFVNVWAFNRIVAPNSQYCSRAWGLRLKARLAQVEVWAERQGLELAADCHLARIMQAAHLLQAPKYTAEDLATLSSTCFKLNSLQLRALLQKYQPTPDEPRLPHELIDNVVRAAENLADELARSDGREVKLEEDPELALPFLLPEDGYSCEVVRGIPAGLAEFVGPLQHMGLCRLSVQPTSNGLWTVYMGPANAMVRSPSAMSNRSGGFIPTQQQPEIQMIKLHKSNNGMGLSIVAAKGAGQDRLGIYIKSVVKGGAADADGRLQAGDQLLKVDGQSLVGITQEKAAEYLVRTGPVVTLEVAKQGAIYHGLATLLSQPSPVMARGPRRMSERDLPSRVLSEQQNLGPRGQLPPQIHSSKSVPSLHSGNHELHGSMVGGGMVGGVGGGTVVGGGVGGRSHEVFNPGYSRTSSTNSIPPPTTLRSRSSQNLTEHRGNNIPPNSGNLGNRQASNPSLAPNQSPPHAHPHPIPPSSYQQHVHNQQQLLHQQYNQHQQHQQYQQQQNSPTTGENGERFYQNLSIYRNQEIQNGFIPQGSGRGKLPSPQDERSPAQLQKSLRGSQSSLTTARPQDQSQTLARPASAYLPPQHQQYPPPHLQQGMAPRSQSSRDMLRQEAKLQEMTEEVRRRELRLTSPQSRLQMNQGPIQQSPIQQTPAQGFSNGGGYPPNARPLVKRDSPPPPPPPATTHPLYQPPRYTASMGDPPRGGYYPAQGQQNRNNNAYMHGTNPWEREEREKELLMRKEAMRQWRDQQIAELTALAARNPQQEEQLRALRLEKEFERRAEEEAEEDEEDDTESTERVQGLLRVARQQDEKRQQQQHQQQQHQSMAGSPSPAPSRPPSHQQVNGIVGRTAMPPTPTSTTNNYPNNTTPTGPGVEEKERLRRLKDLKMKQAEMEAEARLKRRDEELRQQQINNSQTNNQSTPLASHPRSPPRPPAQYNGYSPPPPPERGSSFQVMSQTQGRSPVTPVNNNNNNNTSGAKRVSFQDPSPPPTTNPPPPPLDNIREDPNNFINEAETMLASPTSPDTTFTGTTPGVIGAQEVYKDPRQRRLLEQQNQKMAAAKVPEKLSFKEKMKMFAMETGEDTTPRDKVKISRAQREIDNIGSPTTPNNNSNPSVSNNN